MDKYVHRGASLLKKTIEHLTNIFFIAHLTSEAGRGFALEYKVDLLQFAFTINNNLSFTLPCDFIFQY